MEGAVFAPLEGRVAKLLAEQNDPDFIKSLAKGLAVIEAFDSSAPSMTLSRIAEKVGLSPGSARRVLVTLSQLGYVDYNKSDRRYHLAARTLQLGYSYLVSLPALNLIQPRLAELSDRLNESCSIMVRDGREVVCVARATAKRLQRDYMAVGTRFPAHASPSGKLLLGALSDAEFGALYSDGEVLPKVTPFSVRNVSKLRTQVQLASQQGWIFVDQEVAIGMGSVAVPLRSRGVIRYGLATSATLTLDSSVFVDKYLPELHAAAESMETLLEAVPQF